MRLLLLSCLILLPFCASPEPPPDYAADRTLLGAEQADLLSEISRYVGRLPRHGTHQTKFEARFDEHYAVVAAEHRIDLAHVREADGTLHVMVSRIAPSLHIKRVGIGIAIRRDTDGRITHYEEVFRTWRMTEEELAIKGGMLFHRMVAGLDLAPYLPETSGGIEYIEFPNQHTHFDIDQRQWVSTLDIPMETTK